MKTIWGRAIIICSLATFFHGCVALDSGEEVWRESTEVRARERTLQHRTRIPETPVELTGDYSEPPLGIRQLFRWAPYENEWRLTLVDRGSLYAGFWTRRAVRIPRQRFGMALYFELHPAEIACSLAIGLRDDAEQSPEQIPIVPIAPYRLFRRFREDRGIFVIPLRDFEEKAHITDEAGQWIDHKGSLNWRTIQGVQLVILDPDALQVRQITIKNLQIAPKTGILELQSGAAATNENHLFQ